jgi:hypothetical protein
MHSCTPRIRAVARLRLLGLACCAAAVACALLAWRPALDRAVLTWTGDELVLVLGWALACALSAWLALVSTACAIALHRSDPVAIAPLLAVAPAFVRRIVEAALVVSCVAGTAPAAHAIGSDPGAAPSPTVVVHVRPDGVFAATAIEEPVVRGTAPAPPTSTRPTPPPTTAARTASTTTVPQRSAAPTPPGPTAPPATAAPIEPTPYRRATPATTARDAVGKTAPQPTARTHVVQPGDNLWTIAHAAMVAARGDATTADVAPYWRAVIDANRSSLRSGDPNLIFPGELVALPPHAGLP